jgi:hypothetical protein
MTRERLTAIGDPPFFICTVSPSDFFNLGWQIRLKDERAITRIIRGRHARTLDAFYSECAAALQLPYYFGENWDAFNDVIRDLEWLPGDSYLLMFDDAHLLLDQESPRMLEVLIRLLAEASAYWRTPSIYYPRNRNPTPFHTIFRCDTPRLEPFLERLSAARATFEVLDLPV